MKSKIWIVFITLFISVMSVNQANEFNHKTKRVPAEWEPQEATWMQWPGYWEKDNEIAFAKIADQEEAPTHSGTADLDLDTYKIADTVVVTINDQDLNVDSELIDVYLTHTDGKVGDESHTAGGSDHIMDITFDDTLWEELDDQTFTIVETDVASGIFIGSFQVPSTYNGSTLGTTGTDIEVNYQDFRDGSGNTIEVGDGASIRANTGSISFDRSVYPVPFDNASFKEHATADGDLLLAAGNVEAHIRITDADLDISAVGEDSVLSSLLDVKITRGALKTDDLTDDVTKILEVSPDSGVFEFDLTIASNVFADSTRGTFASTDVVNQGDIITATYTDAQDASGKSQTVTDSLQSKMTSVAILAFAAQQCLAAPLATRELEASSSYEEFTLEECN
jgi:hypothetical protein